MTSYELRATSDECRAHVSEAVTDAYKRLLKPSIETEFAALSKEKADVEAIRKANVRVNRALAGAAAAMGAEGRAGKQSGYYLQL